MQAAAADAVRTGRAGLGVEEVQAIRRQRSHAIALADRRIDRARAATATSEAAGRPRRRYGSGRRAMVGRRSAPARRAVAQPDRDAGGRRCQRRSRFGELRRRRAGTATSKAASPRSSSAADRRAVARPGARVEDVHRRLADERGDEQVGRPLLELGRRARTAAARPSPSPRCGRRARSPRSGRG